MVRVVAALVASGLVGFGLTYTLTPTDAPTEPAFWQPPPLRAPPLDLSSAYCSQVPAPAALPPVWTEEAAVAHLEAWVADQEEAQLLYVDCGAAPCIAWLRWADGRTQPERTYRWWSLDDAPDAALWTASHAFQEPEATLEAVVIAPARPTDAEHAAIGRRVAEGRARLAN